MGATLPLLARHAVRNERQIGSRVGALYAVNTVGRDRGTVCAAFWLIPELGLRRTVWVGAALNGAVFALAALLARGAPLRAAIPATRAATRRAARATWILPAIALSGAVSFAYEVLWTRLLGHVLGAQPARVRDDARELPARHRARQRGRRADRDDARARAASASRSRSSGSR